MANQKLFSPSPAISGFCGRGQLPYGGGCSFRLLRRSAISLPTFPESMKKVRPLSYSRPSTSKFLPKFPLLCSASAICEVENDDGAPSPSTLSSPLILIGDEDDDDRYCFYSPSGGEKIIRIEKNQKSWRRKELVGARLVGSSKGWIASINPRNCNLFLSNPLSAKTSPIIPLPPIETLPLVTSRHFTRRRTDDPSSEYQFDYYDSDYESKYDENDLKALAAYRSGMTNDFDTSFSLRNHPSLAPARVAAEKLSERFVQKVTMSWSDDWDKRAVAIIYGYESEFSELALCVLGDSGWTPLECPLEEYVDILFSKHTNNGKLVLFALTYLGATESYEFDHHNLSCPHRRIVKMSPPEGDKGSGDRRHLVETSSGHLLMVRDSVRSSVEFDVHRLDREERKWVRVECLGDDEALFVSNEESALLSVGEFSGLRPNCVYFVDCDRVGVFSLEDKSVVKEKFGYDVNFLGKKKKKPLPFWLVPNPF